MINLILWEPFNFTIWNKCEDSYAGPDKLVLRTYKQESIQRDETICKLSSLMIILRKEGTNSSRT